MSEIQKSNHARSSFLRKGLKVLMWFLLVVIVLLVIFYISLNAYLNSSEKKVLDNLGFLKGAQLSFEKVEWSVFKNFPDATLSLKIIELTEPADSSKIMLTGEELDLGLSIGEILKKQIVVNSIDLQSGNIDLTIDKNGTSNFLDLINSKAKNTTHNSRDWKVSMNDLKIGLNNSIIYLNDQSRGFTIKSETGNLVAQLKNSNNQKQTELTSDYLGIELMRENGATLKTKIESFQSTITSDDIYPALTFTGKVPQFVYKNQKGLLVDCNMEQLNSHLQFTDNQWILDTDMVTNMNDLIFSKNKDSFVPNTTLTGNFQTQFEEGKISIRPFELTIDEELFLFEANFHPGHYNKITLENNQTNFTKTIAFLPTDLQKDIRPYQVKKPFYSKTKIEGPFKKGIKPIVTVDIKLSNNEVEVLGEAFQNVKLEGQFTNQIQQENGKWLKSKNDFQFKFNKVFANYQSFDLSTPEVVLTNHTNNGLAIKTNAKFKGKASYISDWYKNDQFFFEKGIFDLGVQINAPFKSFNDILIASNATLNLQDFAVWYEPANVSFPFEKLDVAKKSGDANFNIVNNSFVKGHDVIANGILQNINALLFNNADLPTKSDMHIVSKKLTWVDFINLFSQNGYTKNEKQKSEREKKSSMKETIRGMYYNFQPHISIEVDTLAYYDILQMEQFKTGVHFQDPNTLILEKTSFNYDRGTIDFSGKLDISDPDKTPFEFELHTKNLNLNKLLPSFDYFNIKLLEDIDTHPDDVRITIKHSGIIDDDSGVIAHTSTGEIQIESQAHNGTYATISYQPNEDQSKLETKINIEGDPSLFNEFFKTEQFFFSEGRFNVTLEFLGDLKSKEQLMTETVAIFAMHDAYVYYKPVDVNFPLKQVDLNLKQDKADFSFFVRSDSMNRQILFNGEVENLSEIIIGNTGKAIKMNVNINSPILEWGTLVDIFIPENNAVEKKVDEAAINEMSPSNIKASVSGLMRTFNPTIRLNLSEFIYSDDLVFNDLHARLSLQDSANLVLDNTSFDCFDGHMEMNGTVNLDQKNKTSFQTHFISEKVDINKLIKGLDYLKLPSLRSIESLTGDMDMNFKFEGTIAKGGKGLIDEDTRGFLDFKLRDVGITGFPYLDTIATKMRMKRRFDDIQFATLSNKLTIQGNEIDIPLMEVQSNALSLFIEGKLSYGDNTNIWLSFPTSNLRLRDYNTIPDTTGYAVAGRKLFVEITSDDDGANHYRFRLRKKRFYKTRGMPQQFRKDRKRWRKERRMEKKK